MLDTKWPPLLLLLMLLGQQLQAFDYCDPTLCPGPERHIACNNFGVRCIQWSASHVADD